MPTPQAVEIHHSANARFQSGNRVYRIVILGQGGVGKSGEGWRVGDNLADEETVNEQEARTETVHSNWEPGVKQVDPPTFLDLQNVLVCVYM